VCYDAGDGVAKDQKKALKWFKKAVDECHEKAQSEVDRLEQELGSSGKRKAGKQASKQEKKKYR